MKMDRKSHQRAMPRQRGQIGCGAAYERPRFGSGAPRLTRAALLFGVCFLLFGATFILPAPGFAQEETAKRGSIKGNVSLVNASQERSTSEGLSLQLEPLAGGSPSRTAATDAAGNYEFKDVPDGDYVLQLNAEGIEAFKAALHVQGGADLVQDISVKDRKSVV